MSTQKPPPHRRSTIRLLLSATSRPEALTWLRALRHAGLNVSHRLALSIDEFALHLMAHPAEIVITSRIHEGRVGRLELDALTLLNHQIPVVAILPPATSSPDHPLPATGVTDRVPAERPDLLTAVVRRLTLERDLRAERSRHAEAHLDRVRLAALSRDVGSALTRGDHLADSLQRCMEALVQHLDAALARIWSLDPAQHELVLRASDGPNGPDSAQFDRIPIGHYGVGVVARDRRPYLTNQVFGDPHIGAQAWLRETGIASYAAYPLLVGEKLVGVVAMFGRRPLTGFTLNALASVAHEIALELGRRQTEKELEDAEIRFRLLAENLPGVFWLADPARTRFSYVSPGFEAVFGQPLDLLYENGAFWAMAVHPDDRARFQQALAGDWTSSRGVEVEYRIGRPDGGQRWIRDRAFAIREVDRPARRVAGIAEDITRQKQLETQFLQAQKMQSIGRLAGGVAHDFNNLLTAIGSFARMAYEGLPPGAPARSDLEQVLQATQRAGNLTRQLLAFARLQPVEPVIVNPNDHLVSLTKMLKRLVREDAELVVQPGAGVGQIRIDPAQFEQLLVNLVVNAVHAVGPQGLITIETADTMIPPDSPEFEPGVQSGPYVLISVADNGCGMSDEVQAHLFEPFFTTRAPGQGTGLGLATVYGIVKQSGGHIACQSRPGVGTVFRLYLPRVDGLPAVGPPLSSQRRLPRGRETILLVEDDPKVREVVLKVLRLHGYTVLETFNGEQALELVEAADRPTIHLVLTDLIMPRMGGKELSERLADRAAAIPVLFMSGYADEAYGGQALLDAGIPFLPKPFTPEQLLIAVRNALDRPAA